jgi:hypothetical protein
MITGCNTNVSHRGKLFHVQTEDSGRAHPHIISHVYHGGTIIASEKSDYSDRIDSADLDLQVRGLIEEQHQAMLSRLRAGELDAVIDERLTDAQPAATADADSLEPSPAESDSATTGGATTAGATADGSTTGGGHAAPSVADEHPALQAKESKKKAAPAFGDGVDSQKPLDEVILEYLVDKARDRSSEPGSRASRTTRSKG